MSSLKEMYQKYLDLDDNSRVNIALNCGKEIISYLSSHDWNADQRMAFIVNLFKLFVSADKSTGDAEYNFFKRVTGYDCSYDAYFDAVNYGSNSDFVATFDNFIDSMPNDLKYSTLTFGLCVMACDGKLTVTEQQLLDRLLA